MPNIFQKQIKIIDKYIEELNSNTLSLKNSLELLKTATTALESAKDLLLSQNNTISNETNNFLMGNNLEKYYKDLLIRKKMISELNEKYRNLVLQSKLKLDENKENNDNETETLLIKEKDEKKQEVELGFIMDKKETLMNKGIKDLEEIKDNIGEIKENISKQKSDLNELEDIIDENENNTSKAEGIIDFLTSDKKRSKILLYVINIFLLILIITIIIRKIFK